MKMAEKCNLERPTYERRGKKMGSLKANIVFSYSVESVHSST